ncbi:hypothetical protein OE88DRAFT_1731822 [Heliocybe sulcata]|uniref:Translation initiation factor 3 N-terminal domain-containing protein n=1 Tax=Heliocybe sulcata TaxID=5364 RepID=A0A5C3NFV1_9AGAM|nr:hypothetical protein OE88DRAFT_1731822 [Heliocybe sulcata]
MSRPAGRLPSTSRVAERAIWLGAPLSHAPRRLASSAANDDPPRNEKIPYRTVRLVDPETSKLLAPTPLTELLKVFDDNKFFLELVATNPEPIVKLVNKREARQRRLEARKQERTTKKDEKEIQMTWKIAGGDLSHKLKKVRQELEKGNRINLVYALKKGQQLPTPQEKDNIVRGTLDQLEDIAREWKPREQAPRLTVIYLEKKKEK